MLNELNYLIDNIGVDQVSELLAEYVNQKILSEDVAMQFVLEEIEAASKGSDVAKMFAESSGFDEDDYLGAMHNSFEEVDGENGPQQEILNLCMMLYPDRDLMAELRIKTVDNIMKHWELGKYAQVNKKLRLIDVVKKNNNLPEGIFANINNDLNDSVTSDNDIMILMAYGYTRRTAAAGLYLQGVFNRASYEQASDMFKSLQLKTGQSVEFQEEAAEQAEELLLSYDKRFTREITTKIITVVEHDQVESAYENEKHFSDEQIFQIFTKSNALTIIYDKYGDEYKEIVSPYTGKIWLDRNLGAKRVPTSHDDKEGFGDYFQWGRSSDGHEKIDSKITNTLSKTNKPNHNDFIIPIDEPFDWTINNQSNLWKGLDALNSPCPKGYRLPTLEELVEETVFSEEHNNILGVYNDFLKIPAAGCRNSLDGKLYHNNTTIFLWTSDTLEKGAIFLSFNKKEVYRNASYKAAGASIRCIKD